MIIKQKVAITIIALFSLAIIATPIVHGQQDSKKELCKDNGGEWEDGACDTKGDDDKADKFLDDVEKIEEFEEEKADLEDALWDDQEDSEKFDVCQ